MRFCRIIKHKMQWLEILKFWEKLSNCYRMKQKKKYPNIPWKDIARTRDKLIHDYFGVNIDIIWDIAKNEIPTLFAQLKDI